MRRISSVLLFSFVGVLSLAGQNLIKPKQIAPDTLNRIIIMTDTITEVDTVFREFKYYSIDSLVRQIVNDSLGIDSLWKKDGTYSLRQNYSPNNNFLFGTNVGDGLTGSYNVLFNNNAPTGSDYNFINGLQNFNLNSDANYNFSNGYRNYYLGTGVAGYSFTNGFQNFYSNSANYNFGNGISNFSNNTLGGSNFANGAYNFQNGTGGVMNFGTGEYNFQSSTGSYNAGFGNSNGQLATTANYNFLHGYFNLKRTTNLSYTFSSGLSNAENVTGLVQYSFLQGRENAKAAASISETFALGFRNLMLTTSALSRVIAIGTENGYNNVSHSNSIYLGYRQGYTTGAANKLMIGMNQDDYLLGGDFSADWIRVNGYFEVRDKTGTAGNIAAWDGDKLVDSGTSLASIGGDPDQTLSYNGATSDLTISGTGGNTIALPEMVAYPIGSTGYGYRPEISAALAGGEPLLITEGSGINIVDNGFGTGFSIAATDASTTNELQTISKSGELVTLSDSGGSFSTHTIDTGTDIVIVQPGGTTSDVVVDELQFSYDGADAPTTIAGRNAFNRLAQVAVGSGLSFNTGTGTLTATDASTTNEIQTLSYTSTTGAISLSTGGGTITLNPPIGGLLSGSGTFTSSTPTKINFTSSLSDGITASTVNEDLTIPATGYYRITANGIIAVEDDAVFNVYIYVNGSVARSYSLTQTAGNDARVISFNFIQSLTSGWAVDVRVAKTSGSSNVQASSWDLMAEFIKT